MNRKGAHIDYSRLIRGDFDPPVHTDQVPDFAYSPLNRSGQLYEPVIDKLWIRSNPAPIWPSGKRFAVCLSHDVDSISELDPGQNIRKMKYFLKTLSARPVTESLRWLLIHKLNGIKGLVRLNENLCHFDEWLHLEAKYGAVSTFFFPPEVMGRAHASDCGYHYEQQVPFEGKRISVAELIQKLDKSKNEVGLHPSWYSHADAAEMSRQKSSLDGILMNSVRSVRQHFLKFDPQATHQVQAKAGFEYDVSLGFNDNVGFRRGTSYPFKTGTGVLALPLTAQDGALLLASKGLRLNVDQALEYLEMLTQKVEDVGGVLSLSWHPHTYHQPGFFELYEQTLAFLADRDPWFATTAEIGDWWLKNECPDLLEFCDSI